MSRIASRVIVISSPSRYDTRPRIDLLHAKLAAVWMLTRPGRGTERRDGSSASKDGREARCGQRTIPFSAPSSTGKSRFSSGSAGAPSPSSTAPARCPSIARSRSGPRLDVPRDPPLGPAFIKECRRARRLQHPNTVRVSTSGAAEGLLHGHRVPRGDSRCARRSSATDRMPPPRVLASSSQCCQSLGEAHASGMIHRDLKPDTLPGQRRAGSRLREGARLLRRQAAHQRRARRCRRRRGISARRRTCRPSRRAACRSTPAATSTALGAIAYEMLTGRPPFSPANPVGGPRDAHVRRAGAAARRDPGRESHTSSLARWPRTAGHRPLSARRCDAGCRLAELGPRLGVRGCSETVNAAVAGAAATASPPPRATRPTHPRCRSAPGLAGARQSASTGSSPSSGTAAWPTCTSPSRRGRRASTSSCVIKRLRAELAERPEFLRDVPRRGAPRRAAQPPEHRPDQRGRRRGRAATSSRWSTSTGSRCNRDPAPRAGASDVLPLGDAPPRHRRRAAPACTTRTSSPTSTARRSASCTATSPAQHVRHLRRRR